MNYMQQPMPNPEDILDPKTTIDMALVLMANAFKLNNTTPINNNQISSSNPRDRQIAQSGNRNGYNLVQNVGNLFGQNAVQNSNIQKIANQKDRSAEVHQHENNSDNNMFTQEEHYTDLLEFTTEPHLVQQNDNNVIPAEFIMESSGGTVEQHPTTVEETRAFFESLYNNLVMEVEKVNIVNHKMKETNAELTTMLARYKGQEKYKHDHPAVYDSKETLKLAQESHLKLKQLNKEIKLAKYAKIALRDLYTIRFYTQTQDQENRGLDLKRREEKSLIYNTSFLGEYECSSLALDRRRKKVEDEIGSLETRLIYVSDQEI
ncbi:hypothetical protein Tco_0103837 [Tanacetum coccineum]